MKFTTAIINFGLYLFGYNKLANIWYDKGGHSLQS